MSQKFDYSYIDEYRDGVVELLKKKDANLVPIPKDGGKALTDAWRKWQSTKYTGEIPFDQDFAVICGKISLGLVILDLELKNVPEEQHIPILKEVIEKLVPDAFDITLVVKTGNGYHVYLYVKGDIATKSYTNNGVTVEVKSTGAYVIGPTSRHFDKDEKTRKYYPSGKVYKIASNVTDILEIENVDLANRLNEWVGLTSGKSNPTQQTSIEDIHANLKNKRAGSNRQLDLIRSVESILKRNPHFDFVDALHHAKRINEQFAESYPEPIVKEKTKEAWNFAQKIINGDPDLENNELYRKLWDDQPEEDDVMKNLHALAKICIKTGKMVIKSELRSKLNEWLRKHQIEISRPPQSTIIVDTLWEDNETFTEIKKICRDLGLRRKPMLFDMHQEIEAAEWIIGRRHTKYVEAVDKLVYWDEKCYIQDKENLLEREAHQCLIKTKNNSISEVMGQLKRSSPIMTQKDIERDVNIKCCNNGTFYVKTKEFVKTFSPDNYVLNRIPHNYIENGGDWSKIEEKISDVIPDEKDRQSYHDFISHCFIPYSGIDTLLGLIGPPGTGKTQLIELASIVLGDDNVEATKIHEFATDKTLQQDIAYKMMIGDEDFGTTIIKDLGILKSWVTQDKLGGRSIYGHNEKFRPSARILFAANSLFSINNKADFEAMCDRGHLLKVTRRYRDTDEQILNVMKQFKPEEYDAYVTYLLNNANEILELGRFQYPQHPEVTKELWEEIGGQIKEFKEEHIIPDSRGRLIKDETWEKWFEHAFKNKFPCGSKEKFFELFENMIGITAKQLRIPGEDRDGPRPMGYFGWRFKRDDEYAVQKSIIPTKKEKIELFVGKLNENDAILDQFIKVMEGERID